MLLPFLWMLSTSLKELNDVFDIPISWIPEVVKFDNYPRVFEVINFGRYYLNNIIITVLRLTGLFFTATMCGYGLARKKFPGRNIVLMLLLSTMMVPIHVIMYPVYIMISNFGWTDSYIGLTVPQMFGAFGGAFSIFLMKQNFEVIPKELEEAAIIDGAGEFRMFFSVMLPQVKSGLASFFIFAFMAAWNDYIYPLVIVNTDSMKNLPLGMAGFTSFVEALADWPLMMAAAVMVILPVIIVFITMQKYFIDSEVSSGLKG